MSSPRGSAGSLATRVALALSFTGSLAGTAALAVALALAGPLACASAPGSPPRRNGMEAPPPFATAPDFSVADANGVQQTLGSLMGPKGLVLVLYRGHW